MTVETQRTRWAAIIILYGAGLVGAMQFAKMSPIMQMAADALRLSPLGAGLSVSLLGLVGVLFAITVGAIANAMGLARTLRAALFGGAAVALAGAFAPEASSFLLTRFLEGVSHLFIVVCTPALMAAAAAPKDKPLALALWGCFFGAGYALTSIAAPYIVGQDSWRHLLIAHAVVTCAVAAAVTAVTRADAATGPWPGLAAIARKHLQVLAPGAILLLALTFFAYTIQFLAVLTFLHVFMTEVLNWPAARTGLALFVAPLWSLVFTLASGLLVRAGVGIGTGFAVTFAGLALSSLAAFALPLPAPLLMIALAVMMACFGLLPGLAFANMPRVARNPEQATLAFSAIALFGNLGTFLGTPLLALVHGGAGWTGVAAALAAVCAAGIGLALALTRAVRQNETLVT